MTLSDRDCIVLMLIIGPCIAVLIAAFISLITGRID